VQERTISWAAPRLGVISMIRHDMYPESRLQHREAWSWLTASAGGEYTSQVPTTTLILRLKTTMFQKNTRNIIRRYGVS
jgi:hypothetical protein